MWGSWALLYILLPGCVGPGAPSTILPDTVKVWADTLGSEMYAILTKYSGSLLLQKKYKDVEPTLSIEEVDGLELVKKFSEEMESMLRRKVEAVERLVEAAEEADLNHDFNESMEFEYYNSVRINEKDEDDNYVELGNEFILEANEHFNNLKVNTTLSNIQLPTNVYNKDPDILNGVYMSEALNPVFVENFHRDPTLTWQYFGSSTGFFRLYPGIKWTPDENGVISFDCRNRGWYIQAATSPKDIVIIVDISGSMKGLRMTIAKHTINTLLDTLGENDFVNIIAYNDYVHYIEPCFKGILVQADRDNREHFKQLVDELQAKGVGTVNKALIEAFKILKEFREAGQGGLCNQAIMLITDGAVEEYEPVFEKYNWPEKRVRMFTYLIGREVTFAQNVKWIACSNKEMMVPYRSSLRSEGILLGVVGSDVPLRELLKLAPRYKLGVHGYAFLNTNNGYILSHPDLRPLYKEGKKLRPKPNYNSVDLSEVEWEDRDENLRSAMINGETGTLSMDVKVTVDKGKRVLFMTCDYFYTDISDTPFSLGVVLTRGHGEYILIGNTSLEEGLHDLLHPDLTLANEWIYCITDIDPDHRKLNQLQAVTRFLMGEDPDLECDEELVKEVLFDAVVTAPLEAYWTQLALNLSKQENGIEVAFLGTRAGLIRKNLFVGAEQMSNKKFLQYDEKESIFTMDHFPLWYRRAAEHPPGSFVFHVPTDDSPDTSPKPQVVTVSTSIAVTVHNKTAIAAAIGVQMKLSMLRDIFRTVTQQPNDTDCSDVDGMCPMSCEDEALNCFLIDNNGFIVVAREHDQTGIFLGEVDGSLMMQLLNMGVFRQVTLYDYQAMCKHPYQHHSGGRTLLNPLFALISAAQWLLSNLVLFVLEFSLCPFWSSENTAEAKSFFHHSHKHKKHDMLQPCDTEYPAFIHETSIQETNGLIDCGHCQKMFVMQQVVNSNLLLLVSDSACDCSAFPKVLLQAKEVKYILSIYRLNLVAHNASVKCERMRSQKLRRRPHSCHDFHPEENAQDCGRGSGLKFSLMLLLTSLAISLR
ncbi:voltage-dependent calcium channel subunit alpha-2/delta-4 [Mantella aurantiaca]